MLFTTVVGFDESKTLFVGGYQVLRQFKELAMLRQETEHGMDRVPAAADYNSRSSCQAFFRIQILGWRQPL